MQSFIQELSNVLKINDCKLEERELYSFAINVFLMREGTRIAYCPDLFSEKANNLLVEYVLKRWQEIDSLELDGINKILFLSENEGLVARIIGEENGKCQRIGKVLGYRYVGDDWKTGDCYNIAYLVEYKNVVTTLYSFMVPVDKYTDEIRRNVIKDFAAYEDCLQLHRAKVSVITRRFI